MQSSLYWIGRLNFERGEQVATRWVHGVVSFKVSAVRVATILVLLAFAAAAAEEHEAIYRAIREGEPEAAAEATSVHLDNTLEDYRREIQRRVFG